MPETKSGIITTPSGERHIPASVRPDGSTRREIKIRPGYRPPEDVEIYKNRAAESWKNRGSGGVPGAEGLKDKDEKENYSAASNKNAKRREARKKAKAATEEDGYEGGTGGEGSMKSPAKSSANDGKAVDAAPGPQKEEPLSQDAEKEKQARNLRKKLRQAKELMDRKEHGENLLPEQLEKVIKINELVRQLDGLGFDSEGNLKEPLIQL